MTGEGDFLSRIPYRGDLKVLLERVCQDYDLGAYSAHVVIAVGYEDLNVVLETSEGQYFIKIFAEFRSPGECSRYVEIMLGVIEAGVQHPNLYESSQGYLYEALLDGSTIRLCVLEYIEGKSFYDLRVQPTVEEIKVLARQAALINRLQIKLNRGYDSWAIVNFVAEFENKRQFLNEEDLDMVSPLAEAFRKIDLGRLPHCFVHGDITKTNVLRDSLGKLYILDFSVAGYYPRVQELAVLASNLCFDEKAPSSFWERYDAVMSEYQKYELITSQEVEIMPMFIKVAHAVNIICPSYELVTNGTTSPRENLSWLEFGRAGLRFAREIWG